MAEARAKQAATRTALEQSTKEVPQDFTGAEVPEIVQGVPQRAPIRPRRAVLGLTEPEITAKISRIPGIRIYEVGISYYGRTYKEGKKIGWKDGFRAIFCILKYGLFKSK